MDSSAGAETSLCAVDPLLLDAGFEIHLAVLTEHQSLVATLVDQGVTVHDLSGRSVPQTISGLIRLVRRIRPDIIHASLLQAAIPCQMVGPLTRVPVLVTWASTPTFAGESTVAAWKLKVVHGIETAMGAVSRSKFHAVTSGVALTKAKELHVSPRRARVAERGRDQNRYRPSSESKRELLRAELGVSNPGDFVLLAVGRQEPQKDYVTLLRAFDDAVVSGQSIHLFVAGREGSATPELERLANSLSHADQVRFLGQREDVPDLLAAADAIVCTSIREGAAGSLIEAMGVGTPILSVPLEGLEGILEHEQNALVVSRDDLAEGIRRMADDSGLRQQLATSARQLFLDRFTIERSAAALADVYRWAASKSVV